ncbi:long-chain fatty acid--CoA ligase, partial [Klebsiella pneumoniae]|nr:long-chain fatty acid--CoA ligase [Klebsiella pneumoniae]
LNILLKSAEFDYYLADSAAVALFCFEGSSGLPLGEEALRAAAKAEQCREVFIIGDRLPLEGERFSAAIAAQATEFASAATLESDT